MQTFRFEIVPSPLMIELPDFKDGKTRRRERRKKQQKNKKW
jgi:hypothetical protein